jgi:hypothetical protein
MPGNDPAPPPPTPDNHTAAGGLIRQAVFSSTTPESRTEPVHGRTVAEDPYDWHAVK